MVVWELTQIPWRGAAAAAAQVTADANTIILGALAIPESWAIVGDNELIPDAKIGRQIYVQSNAVNINSDLGHTPGDIVFEIILGLIKVYQRNASGPPFYTLVGSTTAASELAGIAAWALSGNDDEIPAAKFPFPIPDWLADPVGSDIPFSLLESTLFGWVEAGNEDPIPDDKLPTSRFVPSSVGQDDGSRISALDGEWIIAAPSGDDVDQDPTVWRIEYVRSDDIAGQLPGKVYIRLRYLDSFNVDTGNRSRVIDTGSGYLTSNGGRTISLNAALDIRALLQSSSLSALMTLVTSIPNPGSATWGEWYGHTDADGRILGVYYRREQETTEMDWWAERLSSTNRNLHGYAQVSRSTYQKGGALYPTNEGIEELIEEQDANDNVTVRAIVSMTAGSWTSGISIIMFWADEDGVSFQAAREMPLFHDASYTVAGQRRYVSSLGTEFTFSAGHRYRLHWRNAGQAHDLILNVAQHMVQVADHDHIADLRAEAFEEIYQVEDRVAVLEASASAERRAHSRKDIHKQRGY